MHYPYVLID